MKRIVVVAAISALAAGAMVGGATIAFAQADVIKQRQDNRKAAGAAMRAIKGIIDAKGDTKGAVEQAAKLKELEIAFVNPSLPDAATVAMPALRSWATAFSWDGEAWLQVCDEVKSSPPRERLTAAMSWKAERASTCCIAARMSDV